MPNYVTQYQSANRSFDEVKRNFVVRKLEFERVISDIKTTDKDSSFQHYVFVGRRGSGKSTLLKRIEAEIDSESKLKDRFEAVYLSEEQSGIYKLHDFWDNVIRNLRDYNIHELDFRNYLNDIKGYTVALHKQVIDSLRNNGKQLILLVDNIDRIFKNIGDQSSLFREQLMNYNDIWIIGGSTIMSEQFWKYDMPFYEYFSIIRIPPLSLEDIKTLLKHWSVVKNVPRIADFLKKHPGKIQAIRILTDGTPRTMLFFIDLLVDRKLQNGYEYLQRIIDQATPIYQERLGRLSPAQQKVLTELSFFWEACSVDQLISKCKMEGKTISAILNQLSSHRYIEKIKGPTKNLLYRLEERFFNLWLLITQGGPQQRKEARYLTVFLESWYDKNELSQVYREFRNQLKTEELRPDYIASMTKALSKSTYIKSIQRDHLLADVKSKKLLNENLVEDLPETAEKLNSKAKVLIENEEYEEAFKLLNGIDQDDPVKFRLLGVCHYNLRSFDLAQSFYEQAIKLGDVYAMFNLGRLYHEENRNEEAEEYYKMAIEKEDAGAMNDLANLYVQEKREEEAEAYYKMAIEKGNADAMYNLANLYANEKREEEAEAYYKMAIKKENADAMNNLAVLYVREKREEEAEAYYKMAIEKDNTDAMNNLANLYVREKREEEAEAYYKMAIEKENIGAMNNLANLYVREKREEEAEAYYKMAIENGNIDAMFNLGNLFLYNNRIEEAKEYYKMACKKRHTGAITNLANLYLLEGNITDAEYHCKLALELGDNLALVNLGNLYRVKQEYDKAEEYYRKAIEMGNSLAIYALVTLLYNLNQKEKFEKRLEDKLIDFYKHDFISMQSVSIIYLWLGKIDLFDDLQNKIREQYKPADYEIGYFKNLLIHGQKHSVYKTFTETPELKERFWPLFYAVISLIDPTDTELLKMPPELKENVDDILKEIKEKQKFYYPDK